jgi:hypothetical protein
MLNQEKIFLNQQNYFYRVHKNKQYLGLNLKKDLVQAI